MVLDVLLEEAHERPRGVALGKVVAHCLNRAKGDSDLVGGEELVKAGLHLLHVCHELHNLGLVLQPELAEAPALGGCVLKQALEVVLSNLNRRGVLGQW